MSTVKSLFVTVGCNSFTVVKRAHRPAACSSRSLGAWRVLKGLAGCSPPAVHHYPLTSLSAAVFPSPCALALHSEWDGKALAADDLLRVEGRAQTPLLCQNTDNKLRTWPLHQRKLSFPRTALYVSHCSMKRSGLLGLLQLTKHFVLFEEEVTSLQNYRNKGNIL